MKKLLHGLFFVFSLNISSQVYNAGTHFPVYMDINPDTLLNYQVTPYTQETYSINIFGNSSYDLELMARGSVSSGGSQEFIRITSLNPDVYILFGRLDSVYVPANSNWSVTKVAKPLNSGDIINSSGAIWDNAMQFITDHTSTGGGNKDVNDWISSSDKFIGLKYVDVANSNMTYYGWIRVRCNSKDSCYIKDYSRTSSTSGIHETEMNDINIFPNPVSVHFYLKNMSLSPFEASSIKITDLLGNEVNYTYMQKGNDLEVKLDKELPAGSYIISYIINGQCYARKLLKATE